MMIFQARKLPFEKGQLIRNWLIWRKVGYLDIQTHLQVLHPVLALVLNARERLGVSFFTIGFVEAPTIFERQELVLVITKIRRCYTHFQSSAHSCVEGL